MAYIGAGISRFNTADELTVTGDAQIDTTTLVVDSTNNRVGIGTASPSFALEVNAANGGGLSVVGASDTNSGWRLKPLGNDLYISQNGISDNVVFKDGGNVGIGTTSPGAGLEVEDANGIIVSRSGYSQYLQLQPANNSVPTILGVGGNGVHLGPTNTTGIRVDSSGNVGISNASPSQLLSVGGDSSGTKVIQVTNSVAGTAFNDGMQMFINDSAGGLNMRENYPLQIYVNGSERMRITSGGNVGIGETAPANLLHVKASDTGIAPHASAQIVLEREGTNYLQFLTAETGTSGILFGDGSDIDVAQIKYDHSTTSMQFVTEASEAMRITSGGDVLVSKTAAGTGTVGVEARSDGLLAATRDGNQPLLLNRKTSDGNIALFQKDGSTVGSIGNRSTALQVQSNGGVGVDLALNNIFPLKSGSLTDDAVTLGDGTRRFKDLYLSGTLTNDGTGGISINTSGNVGIGESSPLSSLHIDAANGAENFIRLHDGNSDYGAALGLGSTGDFVISTYHGGTLLEAIRVDRPTGNVGIGTSSGTDKLHIENTGANCLLSVARTDGAAGRLVMQHTSSVGALQTTGSVPLTFGTADTERMRIDSSGNLSVGTSNTTVAQSNVAGGLSYKPAANFEVSGNTTQAALFNRTDTGNLIGFLTGGSSVGAISVTGSGTTYHTTSDRRLKENIEPLVATDKLMAMNPVSYTWKAFPDEPRSMGFIAQEMAEIMPEAVSTNEHNDMMSMDYGRITPVLVAALQDAHRKIEQLEQRIVEMENV